MSFEYIKKQYRVPAELGGRIEYAGAGTQQYGTITGVDGGHLLIKLDDAKVPGRFHPTWALRYLPNASSAGADPVDRTVRRLGDGMPADAVRFAGEVCLPSGLMFDAFGEPRTRYVRVSMDGNHCIMHPSDGDRYLQDARDAGDESPYVVCDVYLSEREFEDLPEHDGF